MDRKRRNIPLIFLLPFFWGVLFHHLLYPLGFFFTVYYFQPLIWEGVFVIIYVLSLFKAFESSIHKMRNFYLGLGIWSFFVFMYLWQFHLQLGRSLFLAGFSQYYPFGLLNISVRILSLFPIQVMKSQQIILFSFFLFLLLYLFGFYYHLKEVRR